MSKSNIDTLIFWDLIDNEEDGSILTLNQLKFHLEQNSSEDFPSEKTVSIETIRRHVDEKLHFTLKRTRPIEQSQFDNSTIQKWKNYIKNVLTDPIHYMDNCIFVNECGFNACMVPGRARSKRGKCSHIITKTKRAMNISIISTLSSTRIESIETRNLPGGTNTVIFDESL
jgi:hypothetical protein